MWIEPGNHIRGPALGGKILQEYELTKKMEEEAMESAILSGLDYDENGQVSAPF